VFYDCCVNFWNVECFHWHHCKGELPARSSHAMKRHVCEDAAWCHLNDRSACIVHPSYSMIRRAVSCMMCACVHVLLLVWLRECECACECECECSDGPVKIPVASDTYSHIYRPQHHIHMSDIFGTLLHAQDFVCRQELELELSYLRHRLE
jgi:hypothetical protein